MEFGAWNLEFKINEYRIFEEKELKYMKVLMVCLGNICRSPLAEGILKKQVQEKGLDWEVDSAGTSGWHVGELPDSRSIAIAKQYGIDITDQRSRKFQKADLDTFDLVLAMDTSNYNDILRLASADQAAKVKMILNFAYPNENRSVPDPYYNDGFEGVYTLLDLSCGKIIEAYAK